MKQQTSEKLLIEIEKALAEKNLDFLKNALAQAHPQDIAECINHASAEDAVVLLNQLSGPRYFEVFEYINLETQVQLIGQLNRKQTIKILEELSSDDRVDLLDRLPPKTVETLLPLMAQAEREETKKLLQYGEDTAGSIMTTEYATLPIHDTASEALQHLQKIAPQSETIYYIYIVDQSRVLKGIISLKDLVLAYPYQRIEDIMNRDFISAFVDEDQEVVARRLAKYDLMAIPVIDHDHKLVGIVTVDDAMDVIKEEQTEDVHRLGALEPIETPYLKTKFWDLAKNRILWLLILFFGVSFTGTALKHFSQTIQSAVALVFFVPMIVSSGGNSGSQSVTLITRALAVGDVKAKDLFPVVLREISMGAVLGLCLGVMGFLYAFVLGTNFSVSLAVGLALFGVVLCGSSIGGILPIILKKLNLDPAIMSSPLVASIVDVIGVLIYFNVARVLLS